jgi:hypothetical protein
MAASIGNQFTVWQTMDRQKSEAVDQPSHDYRPVVGLCGQSKRSFEMSALCWRAVDFIAQ